MYMYVNVCCIHIYIYKHIRLCIFQSMNMPRYAPHVTDSTSSFSVQDPGQ